MDTLKKWNYRFSERKDGVDDNDPPPPNPPKDPPPGSGGEK